MFARKIRANLLPTVLIALTLPSASAYDLGQHAWRDRLLVIAAPTRDDRGAVKQRRVVQDRSDAIADRNLRVLELFEDGGSVDGAPLSTDEVAQLRATFGIDAQARVMLLVGYDGGIKRRSPIDTDLRIFFLDIDKMPMRQAEIREKRATGQLVTKP